MLYDPPHICLRFDPLGDPRSPWLFVGDHVLSCRFVVPDGTRTDLASVPRLARLWCDPNGPWQAAAALHDAAYRLGIGSRFQADALFRVRMEHDGVNAIRVLVMYYAVRLGGWLAWWKHRRAGRAAAAAIHRNDA